MLHDGLKHKMQEVRELKRAIRLRKEKERGHANSKNFICNNIRWTDPKSRKVLE